MRVLVTGGAGRIGIVVCQSLLSSGFQVRVFDVKTKRTRKSVEVLQGDAEIFWEDITDPDSVRKAMQNVGAVVHMATLLPTNPQANPERIEKVNVGGTQNVVAAIKELGKHIPFVYASSVAVFGPTPNATAPLDPDKDAPNPTGVYAETKFKGELIIRESGVDCVILRLATHWHCQIFSLVEFRYMFNRSLDNRVEVVHPEDTALAIVNAIRNFDKAKGNTVVITSGPKGRMFHRDRVQALMKLFSLPMPPAERFIQKPDPSDWYDTEKSQELLHYQNKTFDDCMKTYEKELATRYTPLFLPLLRYVVGPLFGRIIVRKI